MNSDAWWYEPDGSTDELLEAMSSSVDLRRLAAVRRFIEDPRELPSDRIMFMISGAPDPMLLCWVCSDEVDPFVAHTVELDGSWREVHPECCPLEAKDG